MKIEKELINMQNCDHKNRYKVMPIPINKNELDYENLRENVEKIINKDPEYTWIEFLICTDCNIILESNEVFFPDKE